MSLLIPTIREATIGDAPALAWVTAAAWPRATGREGLAFWFDYLTHTDRTIWVAEHPLPGKVVGFCSVLHTSDWTGGEELDRLFVHPGYQRFGVGHLLLDKVLDSPTGREQAWNLWVDEHNPAGRLYESYGFRATGDTRDDAGTVWAAMTRPPATVRHNAPVAPVAA